MTRVLYTTPVLRHPADGGPALRVETSIKALSRICELHVLSRVPHPEMGGRAAELFYRGRCRRFSILPGRGPLASRVLGAVSGRPLLRLPERAVRRALRAVDEAGVIIRYARTNDIGVVWLGFGNISHEIAMAIHRRAPELRLVCDTDSVWSRFILRELPYQDSPEKRERIERAGREKEREERELVERCDVTTAVSEVDARYYRSLGAPPEKVRLFSNVVDTDRYRPEPPPAGLGQPLLYLAGSFWPGSPMEQAARWTVTEVLPRIRAAFPGVPLAIVGSGSDKVLADLRVPGVTIHGRVPSVLPYLSSAAVVLVPLWFESGTRFKILEAGACRRAVVSTTLGAEGLDVRDGHDIAIADTPAAFADATLALLRSPAERLRLGNHLHDLVARRYSIAALEGEGSAVLAATDSPRNRTGA